MGRFAQETANLPIDSFSEQSLSSLRRAIHLLPVAAYTCNAEGQLTAYNNRAVALWGRTPKLLDNDHRYCGSFRLFDTDGTPVGHDQCWMALALRVNQPYNGHEIIVERPDGSRSVVLAHAHPFHDEQGKPTGALNVLVDVTEQKQTQERLHRSQLELEDSKRQKSTFLASLAHELRNSLVPLSTGVQLMNVPSVNEDGLKECQQMMEQQMQHMVRLIDDLHDLSRISQGQLELFKEQFDLDIAIQRAVACAHSFITMNAQDLTVEMPDETIYLNGDLTRLTQVFSNLLINAAKSSPRKGAILLNCRRLRDRVLISVHDDGVGSRKDLLTGALDPFAQLVSGSERKQDNMGMNLALAKGLVELHEGTITALGEGPEAGVAFTINLPVAVTDQTPTAPTHSECSAPPLLPRRILVVDDQVVVARSIACLLEAMGHDVCEAYSGEEALEAMVDYRPDVVLCDIAMANVTGIDFARYVRNQTWGQEVLLIACSGKSQREQIEESLEAGFDHHLVKPLKIETLMRVLGELHPEAV